MVDGWQKLSDKFGRKKLAEDLSAAIATARNGFPVPEMDAAYWGAAVDLLRSNEAASKLYLPGDRAPKVGEIFRNDDLAWSLQQIAEHGRDVYYKGEIARKILAAEKMHGGTMVEEDLSKYSAEWVEPISTTYRDWTVYELPPNGQGLAALEMLNILETTPLGQKGYEFGSAKALHLIIEAKKLAYADLKKYIGEPRGQKLPVEKLLSKEWAAVRAKQIDEHHANCDVNGGGDGGRERYDLSDGGGSRREHGFADSEQLFAVWIWRCSAGRGIYSAQPGRIVHVGREIAECAGGAEASAAHNYSGVRSEGRNACGVWDYGRVEPVAGAYAVCG
jgi:gamma-glutamyltranspeptidase/glutathione hydrolase